MSKGRIPGCHTRPKGFEHRARRQVRSLFVADSDERVTAHTYMQPRRQLSEIDKVLSILLGPWGLKREDRLIVRLVSLIILVDGKPISGSSSTQERLIHAGVGSQAGCYMREKPRKPSTRAQTLHVPTATNLLPWN